MVQRGITPQGGMRTAVSFETAVASAGVVSTPTVRCSERGGPPGAEGIANDIRGGAIWFAAPLALASLIRLGLEHQYWGPWYVAWLAAIFAYVAVQFWIAAQPSPLRIRGALAVNFAAICIGYAMIGSALEAAPGWRADDLLYRAERVLFGRDPQQFLAHLRTPWLSTVTILGYISFVGFLVYLFLAEAFDLTRATGRLQLGLMRMYGIGYCGYILFPAAGPFFHHRNLLDPVVQTPLSAYLDAWVIRCCSGVDVWPSLHAAVTCFALLWTLRLHRTVFWVMLLPAAALLLGAVYFQFHYFIDLLSGCILGALSLPVLRRTGSARAA